MPLRLTGKKLGVKKITPFDLHVLGAPPAFVLSQDQTLYKWYLITYKVLNLCNHSDTIACVLYELLVNLELINVGFQTHYQGVHEAVIIDGRVPHSP